MLAGPSSAPLLWGLVEAVAEAFAAFLIKVAVVPMVSSEGVGDDAASWAATRLQSRNGVATWQRSHGSCTLHAPTEIAMS